MARHRIYRSLHINDVTIDRVPKAHSTVNPSYTRGSSNVEEGQNGASFDQVLAAQESECLTLKQSVAVGGAEKDDRADAVGATIKNEYFEGMRLDDQDNEVDGKCGNSHGSGCPPTIAVEGPPRKRHRMRIVPLACTQNLDTSVTTGSSGMTDGKMIDEQVISCTKTSTTKSEIICVNILSIPKTSLASRNDAQQARMLVLDGGKVDDVKSHNGAESVLTSTRDGMSESDLDQLTYYPCKPSTYDPIYGYDPPPMKIKNENVHEQFTSTTLFNHIVSACADKISKQETAMTVLRPRESNSKRRKLCRYRIHDDDVDDSEWKVENMEAW